MNLYEAVNKNKYGFYELKEEYRRYMNTFYENEYYQNDKSIYHKVEYNMIRMI